LKNVSRTDWRALPAAATGVEPKNTSFPSALAAPQYSCRPPVLSTQV
jgi:hypothetical protein